MGLGSRSLGGRVPILAAALTLAAITPPCVPGSPSFGVPRDQLPVCGVQTSERVIALSFDGGPGPYTEMDLQLLQQYGNTASFFVTAKRMAGSRVSCAMSSSSVWTSRTTRGAIR
jgi:peptidoglycan/xylan/chitin deacetylase (PgdA/CDA1 family)